MASFTDLAKTVAANWKSADKETKDYCLTVAHLIKERHAELSEAEEAVCLLKIDSTSPLPTEETKKRSAENNRMSGHKSTKSEVICCLPTIDFDCSGHANESKTRELQSPPFSFDQVIDARRRELQSMIPRRARSYAFGYQRTNQNPGMFVPTSIDRPVAHKHGMTESFDNSSTCAMGTYQQQYPNNRAATDSSATMTWGYGKSPVCTQQGIQGRQMSIMEGNYGDNILDPVISNVSKRAMLSNMMSAIHTFKQPIPHREGNCSFAEHRRWWAPEFLPTLEQEQFHAMYRAQELDITDSDIVGMWLSSEVQEEE